MPESLSSSGNPNSLVKAGKAPTVESHPETDESSTLDGSSSFLVRGGGQDVQAELRSESHPNRLFVNQDEAESTDKSQGLGLGREEINRILRYDSIAYYEILGVSPHSDAQAITDAFRQVIRITHPDKNSFKEAKRDSQRLNKAYDILRNPQTRQEYDNARPTYLEQGKLQPREYGEALAPNAFGYDSGPETTDESEAEADEHPQPAAFVQQIYKKATPFIKELLKNPDQDLQNDIKPLNEQIREWNKSNKISETDFIISDGYFRVRGQDMQPHLKALKENPRDQSARKELQELNKVLTAYNKRAAYPADWVMTIPNEERTGNESNHYDANSSSSGYPTEKDRESSNPSAGNPNDQNHQINSSEDTIMKDQEADFQSKWQPGQTTKGEQILGYIPFKKMNPL
ncbi:MAG: hypothetical protein M1816_005771 [Peltula sp. TS41687]|nr:MAG: hypothetical protein M1816_005771 [Peltula sp. TS41687]